MLREEGNPKRLSVNRRFMRMNDRNLGLNRKSQVAETISRQHFTGKEEILYSRSRSKEKHIKNIVGGAAISDDQQPVGWPQCSRTS